MTFQELFDSLDLSKLEPASDYLNKFENDLSTGTYMGWDDRFGGRVMVIPVNTWICTDTLVGLQAFFMDMKPIAVSYQDARKNGFFVYWLDDSAPRKVREFIRALDDEESLSITRFDMHETVPTDWLGQGD